MEKSLQLLHELNQTRDNVLPSFNVSVRIAKKNHT